MDEDSSQPGIPGPIQPPPLPPERRSGGGAKKALGPLAGLAALLAKFWGFVLLGLKYVPLLLKTGGTMIISVGVYTMLWGWRFAVGFVLLIFIHECGHLLVAKKLGLKVGAPMFIPFLGAFILLKEMPRNAWNEALIGIGGPILGAVGAAFCFGIYYQTGNPLFGALAYTGFWLNLFNLAPAGFLDGGRIVTALSPWFWAVGTVIIALMLYLQFNVFLLLVLLISLPRFFSLFRKKTDAEARYFEVKPWQRLVMGAMYFGLMAALVIGMLFSQVPIEHENHRQPGESITVHFPNTRLPLS